MRKPHSLKKAFCGLRWISKTPIIPDSYKKYTSWLKLETYYANFKFFTTTLRSLGPLRQQASWMDSIPSTVKKRAQRLLDTINHVGLANPGSLSTGSSSTEATLNSSLFELPFLERLLPSQNSPGGVLLQDFWRAYLSPWVLLICISNFEGHVSDSFLELQNLTGFKLFSSNFSGAISLSMIKRGESLPFHQLFDNVQLTISYLCNLNPPQLQILRCIHESL